MMIGPAISRLFIDIGRTITIDGVTRTNPPLLGLQGWQWIYIIWGIPAVVAGIIVLFYLTDRPRHAKWLTEEEREALESELAREKELKGDAKHKSALAAFTNPRVLLLSMAYFGIVTANYGIEFFLPSVLKQWYNLTPGQVSLLAIIPSLLIIPGQLFVGWSSDRFRERRWHAVIPVVIGSTMLLVTTFTQGNLVLTVLCFTIAAAGTKSYMPLFGRYLASS